MERMFMMTSLAPKCHSTLASRRPLNVEGNASIWESAEGWCVRRAPRSAFHTELWSRARGVYQQMQGNG